MPATWRVSVISLPTREWCVSASGSDRHRLRRHPANRCTRPARGGRIGRRHDGVAPTGATNPSSGRGRATRYRRRNAALRHPAALPRADSQSDATGRGRLAAAGARSGRTTANDDGGPALAKTEPITRPDNKGTAGRWITQLAAHCLVGQIVDFCASEL